TQAGVEVVLVGEAQRFRMTGLRRRDEWCIRQARAKGGRHLSKLGSVRHDHPAARKIPIEVAELIAPVLHRWSQVVTQSVIDREARRRPPVVLDVERKLGRVGIEVRRILGVAGEGRQSKKEIRESVARERPIEKAATVIFPGEERDLILLLDVLYISTRFY